MQVVEAYLKPSVDHDDQPCKWERPDLHGLREFCSTHFNWPQAKADEHLLPVMQAFEVTTSQSRIDSYFSFEHRFAKFASKRLAAAIPGAVRPPTTEPQAQQAAPSGRRGARAARGRGPGRGRGRGRRGRGAGATAVAEGEAAAATLAPAAAAASDAGTPAPAAAQPKKKARAAQPFYRDEGSSGEEG